jgi:peptidyl-prolyl cis-trans isomerase A (cyclophilin A)
MRTLPIAAAAALVLATPAVAEDLYATFETSAGKIGVKLLPAEAPVAVKNFVELAEGKKEWTDPRTKAKSKAPLYDGTLFHRVIPGFMIQGGDPSTRGQPFQPDPTYGVYGPGYKFDDELKMGSTPFSSACQLAMANSGPNTNGSQFFITEKPASHLNPRRCTEAKSGVCGYVWFGTGVCGCELVAKIAQTGNSKTRLERVVITSKPPTCK